MLKNEYGDKALSEANKIIKLCMKKKKRGVLKLFATISGILTILAVLLKLI